MRKIIILVFGITCFGITHALADIANESVHIPIISEHIDTKKSITTYQSTNTKSWILGIYPKGKKVGGYIGATDESTISTSPQENIFIGIGISIQF